MNNAINPDTKITLSLGQLLKAAGQDKLEDVKPKRRIIAKNALAPSSVNALAAAAASLKVEAKPSVIVNAKKPANHSAVTIYITKESIEGKGEFLVMRRTRTQESGEVTADDKQNWKFDKSFCYHQGEGSGKPEWSLKKQQCTVDGVKGTFWARFIPTDAAQLMLEGIRANFEGATLVMGDTKCIL
jgi:hypothetical protein